MFPVEQKMRRRNRRINGCSTHLFLYHIDKILYSYMIVFCNSTKVYRSCCMSRVTFGQIRLYYSYIIVHPVLVITSYACRWKQRGKTKQEKDEDVPIQEKRNRVQEILCNHFEVHYMCAGGNREEKKQEKGEDVPIQERRNRVQEILCNHFRGANCETCLSSF